MDLAFEARRFEEVWISSSLGELHEDGWFTDILYRAKSGKEATVYCCRAHPDTGHELIAAKVYRPRRHRAMRNYAIYREGRHITSDRRKLRALKKKTRTGKRVEDSAWIRHEFESIARVYDMGADVPEPLAMSGTALLMEYVGDENGPAPLLHETALEADRIHDIFQRLMHNVEIFLACHMIHADLSAYNVLAWEGEFRIIDFPQAVDPVLNPSAFSILIRDVERICQHFAAYGVEVSHLDLATDLWERFQRRALSV